MNKAEHLGTRSDGGRIVSVYRLGEELPDWAMYLDSAGTIHGPRNVAVISRPGSSTRYTLACCYEALDGTWRVVPAGPWDAAGSVPPCHWDRIARAIHATHGNWSA